MFLSEKKRRGREGVSPAGLGSVTVTGAQPGAFTPGGERRGLTQISPGGYTWQPKQRDLVLVYKGEEGKSYLLGTQQGDRIVLAEKTEETAEEILTLQEGEIWISAAPGRGLHLRRDGKMNFIGDLLWNGGAWMTTPPPTPEP